MSRLSRLPNSVAFNALDERTTAYFHLNLKPDYQHRPTKRPLEGALRKALVRPDSTLTSWHVNWWVMLKGYGHDM